MKHYFLLMRLHKPIGIFLLLWPTLWALWLAGSGDPTLSIVMIFVAGVILMRSAGCVINDFADRDFDKHVSRTRERPLTLGKITTRNALILFFILMAMAFGLVLFLNKLTILLAFLAAAIAMIYPFLKRFTHFPQAGIGIAFAFGVPMAFAAQNNVITPDDWQVFLTAALWAFMYDTLYAMTDRLDDIKIGVKSTAIFFGQYDRLIIALLQVILIGLFIQTGYLFHLKWPYFLSVCGAGLLFCYQQMLIKHRQPDLCFKAFLNNNWVGMIIFAGILFS
ncbi:MAG TPA: 4-hydroxybenzoate octaprenyltransferase [Gammaproteobacteria bacterium]|nr:4-hydroxybenzoate octaprenyltransferase [Gammaproteobacteria bacterium]